MTRDGAKRDDDGTGSEPPERPTVVPEFDVESFARESDEASEIRRRPPSFRNVELPAAEPSSALIRRVLGPPESIPVLALSMDETLAKVPCPKSAFVVGFVDGLLPLDVLVEAIGMLPAEVIEIVRVLVDRGLVQLRVPHDP